MKTIYGIKQKYYLKDYVEFYSARDGNGNRCNIQFGYINSVEYELNVKGEPELRYSVGKFIGHISGGYLISQDAIIKGATPKVPNFGYIEYLEEQIKCNDEGIKNLIKKKEENLKRLKELKNQ